MNHTGSNLDIIVLTEPGQDWIAFSTWYSIREYLPESNPIIVSKQNGKIEFEFFRWTKKLKIPFFQIKNKPDNLIKFYTIYELLMRNLNKSKNVLLLDNYSLFLEGFNDVFLTLFKNKGLIENYILYMKDIDKEEIFEIYNDYALFGTISDKIISSNICFDANEFNEKKTLVNFRKGCGKWINNMIGCPFSNTELIMKKEMTVNEIKVIELWKRMAGLYSIVH